MKNWKAVIFDMDGTLFDTERIGFEAWYAVNEKYHLPISHEFISLLKGRTRKSAQPIFKQYMPEGWPENDVYQDLYAYITEYKMKNGPMPKTDLKRLFDRLKNDGYKIALCSSSNRKNVDLNLSFENLYEYFDAIVDGAMADNGKPAPDLYLKTAELLKLDPNECLVIEDSPSGIHAGNNAGMDVIMVIDTIQPTDELRKICYRIFDHLDDILSVIIDNKKR